MGLKSRACHVYCDFCFLWDALERKVKNKILTADTKQCLSRANVCTRAEALYVPDVSIKASLALKTL